MGCTSVFLTYGPMGEILRRIGTESHAGMLGAIADLGGADERVAVSDPSPRGFGK